MKTDISKTLVFAVLISIVVTVVLTALGYKLAAICAASTIYTVFAFAWWKVAYREEGTAAKLKDSQEAFNELLAALAEQKCELDKQLAAERLKLLEIGRERAGLLADIAIQRAGINKLLQRVFEVSACMMSVRMKGPYAYLPPLSEKLVGEWRRYMLESAVTLFLKTEGDELVERLSHVYPGKLEQIHGRKFLRDVLKDLSREHASHIDARTDFGVALAQLQSWAFRSEDAAEDVSSHELDATGAPIP